MAHHAPGGMSTRDKIVSVVYVLWTFVAVGLSFMVGGRSVDNTTRALVIALIVIEIAAYRFLQTGLRRVAPKRRFVATGVALAILVEGFYMISRPAFACLKIARDTGFARGLQSYAIDLALTVPAYAVIFSVIWWLLQRYRYTFWEYVLVMGIGQTFGDGFVYFVQMPAMIAFLPYVTLNYHAINVVPFLLVRDELPSSSQALPRRFLALPLLVAVYLVCGGTIALVGRWTGLK